MSVSRIVLDSMYARGLQEPDFVALRKRGFAISLSIATFEEIWANSERTERQGVLHGPMRRLAKYLGAFT